MFKIEPAMIEVFRASNILAFIMPPLPPLAPGSCILHLTTSGGMLSVGPFTAEKGRYYDSEPAWDHLGKIDPESLSEQFRVALFWSAWAVNQIDQDYGKRWFIESYGMGSIQGERYNLDNDKEIYICDDPGHGVMAAIMPAEKPLICEPVVLRISLAEGKLLDALVADEFSTAHLRAMSTIAVECIPDRLRQSLYWLTCAKRYINTQGGQILATEVFQWKR